MMKKSKYRIKPFRGKFKIEKRFLFWWSEMTRPADPFHFTAYELVIETKEKAEEIILALNGQHPDQDKINAGSLTL